MEVAVELMDVDKFVDQCKQCGKEVKMKHP